MQPRVVVTGVGATSAWGTGRDALIAGLASAEPRFQPLTDGLERVSPGRGAPADLPRKDLGLWFDTRVLRLATMTRQTTLGCVACGALLRDAGLHEDAVSMHPDRGCYLGSFIVPPAFAKQAAAMRMLSHRPQGAARGFVLDDARLDAAMKKASAFDFLRALPNMPSAHLSIQTGYQGPACTYLGSDTSGLQAVVLAVGAIRSGLARVMLAGGAFCPFQEVHLLWQAQRGMWGEPAPFRGGTGALPGEGAAMICLEERDHALARGATILAEVTGVAHAIDGAVDGRRTVLEAVAPDRVDWAAPTATSVPELDAAEESAWRELVGGAPATVECASRVGFLGPATAPLNLVAGLLAARGDVAPARSDGDGFLGAGLARSARTGDGATVVATGYSLDGVHAAVALRACV